jgi:carbonic anhydrase
MPNSMNTVPADVALRMLKEGNQRFVQGLRSIESMVRSGDLAELAEKGQKPFAIVLACADSRVPTEILFDRGPGDIFVCRVAGNVATPAIMGSMEFAAEQFGSALLVVMGHTRCGAIKAALSMKQQPEGLSPNLKMVVDEIEPAARLGREFGEPSLQNIDRTAWLNVQHTMDTIRKKSPVLASMIADRKVTMVGALCNIENGSVRFE